MSERSERELRESRLAMKMKVRIYFICSGVVEVSL